MWRGAISRAARRYVSTASPANATPSSEKKKIAVVACGTIGASWAVEFLSAGHEVVAVDQNPKAADFVIDMLEETSRVYKAAGYTFRYDLNKFHFDTAITKTLRDADFVQENGPENLAIKQKMFAEIEEQVSPEIVLASSSSGLLPSQLGDIAKHPERVLLGHPFNPPHLIPLVEICGGAKTDPKYVDTAHRFYTSLGKSPILMKKEMKGHIANRLQAAILQEILYLLQEGVVDVASLDKAMSDGPGLRWAIFGQFLNFDLGGGPNGISHMFKHLGPSLLEYMADLGQIREITPEMVTQAKDGVDGYLNRHKIGRPELAEIRDSVLLKILAAKKARLP